MVSLLTKPFIMLKKTDFNLFQTFTAKWKTVNLQNITTMFPKVERQRHKKTFIADNQVLPYLLNHSKASKPKVSLTAKISVTWQHTDKK